ncbi:ComEC/Rec2 family competence protein [Dechloromonas sp. A34]|uniref:ComEC/Rec2 family competence protein n=1 Tax=Dechloromonas sp. A34 TaxID=447588 RepID=UPI0022495F0C|nr:MBL fold metallo-hydrolase [Dechloromonas sp. A34]
MKIDIDKGLLQFFNVDHGACSLLTLPTPEGNKYVLIDCGHSSNYKGTPWYPAEYLLQNGIAHIDLLIVTNFDEDHVSGAPNMVEKGVTVGCILGNPTVPPEAIEHLKSEDGMGNGIRVIVNSLSERRDKGTKQEPPSIPGLNLSWFCNPWPHWDTENNLSLVAHLSIHGYNFLFTGDMERDGFENLLRYQPFASLMKEINVLVAPHHGRENGVCKKLFEEYGCRPSLIIISDSAKQYQSQETVPYYQSKVLGVQGFREIKGTRYVLTTRRDDHFYFSFDGSNCFAR